MTKHKNQILYRFASCSNFSTLLRFTGDAVSLREVLLVLQAKLQFRLNQTADIIRLSDGDTKLYEGQLMTEQLASNNYARMVVHDTRLLVQRMPIWGASTQNATVEVVGYDRPTDLFAKASEPLVQAPSHDGDKVPELHVFAGDDDEICEGHLRCALCKCSLVEAAVGTMLEQLWADHKSTKIVIARA